MTVIHATFACNFDIAASFGYSLTRANYLIDSAEDAWYGMVSLYHAIAILHMKHASVMNDAVKKSTAAAEAQRLHIHNQCRHKKFVFKLLLY